VIARDCGRNGENRTDDSPERDGTGKSEGELAKTEGKCPGNDPDNESANCASTTVKCKKAEAEAENERQCVNSDFLIQTGF
jgi:hypothetical protein